MLMNRIQKTYKTIKREELKVPHDTLKTTLGKFSTQSVFHSSERFSGKLRSDIDILNHNEYYILIWFMGERVEFL